MKPLHPILVHFPIALLSLSVAADVVGFLADIASLRQTGWWTLLAASAGGIATVLAGFYDMSRATLSEEVHHRVHRHMRFGLVLLAAMIGLTVWRWMIYNHDLVTPVFYLDLAVLTVALAAFQGWLGGELVYSDGVFVRQGEASGPELPASGKKAAKEGHSHH